MSIAAGYNRGIAALGIGEDVLLAKRLPNGSWVTTTVFDHPDPVPQFSGGSDYEVAVVNAQFSQRDRTLIVSYLYHGIVSVAV